MSYNIFITHRFEKELKRVAKKFPSLKSEFAKLITDVTANHASNYITISTPQNVEISSQILNQQGQLIMNAGASRSINVSDFNSGVYIVKINGSNNL